MENVILTVHLILALLLIGVVLLQRSEGGGLGMGGGGAMTGRAAATALSKLTWLFAALFICTSITLTVLAAQKVGSSSMMNQIGAPSKAPAVPSTSAPLGSDLLPPVSSDAPLTPPKAEN